jgi:hypothetical protein
VAKSESLCCGVRRSAWGCYMLPDIIESELASRRVRWKWYLGDTVVVSESPSRGVRRELYSGSTIIVSVSLSLSHLVCERWEWNSGDTITMSYLVVGWSEAKMVLICELVFMGNILVWCYVCHVFFYSLLLLYQLIWNLLKAIYRRNKQYWKQEIF